MEKASKFHEKCIKNKEHNILQTRAYHQQSMVYYSWWERLPLEKGGMPMYVTYDELIQLGLLIVAIVGLVFEICHKYKDNDKN